MVEQRVVAAATGGAALLIEGLTGLITWWMNTILPRVPLWDMLGIWLVILVGAPLVVVFAMGSGATRSGADTPVLDTVMPMAYTALALILLFWIWQTAGSVTQVAMWAGGLFVVALIGYTLFEYFGHRQTVGRPAATRRTRRGVQRTFSDWGEFVFGFVAIGLAAVLALFSGALDAFGGVGDAIAPFMGEIAYITTTLTAYLAMGGELAGWGSGSLSDIGAGMFLIIAGLIGLATVMFRD